MCSLSGVLVGYCAYVAAAQEISLDRGVLINVTETIDTECERRNKESVVPVAVYYQIRTSRDILKVYHSGLICGVKYSVKLKCDIVKNGR